MQQPNENKKTESSLLFYAKYSSMAFQMLFIILAGVFGGRYLDRLIGWEFPVFTLVLSVSSVALAIYYAIKDFLKKK